MPLGKLFGETDSTTTAVDETPVPARLTVCGLVPALSVIVTAPVRVPVVVGVKVTLMVQLDPAVTAPGQLLLWAKSPVAAMLEIVRSAVPVFVNETVCAGLVEPTFWLEKVKLVGESRTVGVDVLSPEPVRLTVCGLSPALSVMVSTPVRVPVAAGVKVTLMVQLLPAETEEPQLLVCE